MGYESISQVTIHTTAFSFHMKVERNNSGVPWRRMIHIDSNNHIELVGVHNAINFVRAFLSSLLDHTLNSVYQAFYSNQTILPASKVHKDLRVFGVSYYEIISNRLDKLSSRVQLTFSPHQIPPLKRDFLNL